MNLPDLFLRSVGNRADPRRLPALRIGRLGACHHHIELCFGGVELVISGNIHCRCQVDSVYAFRPMASSTSR